MQPDGELVEVNGLDSLEMNATKPSEGEVRQQLAIVILRLARRADQMATQVEEAFASQPLNPDLSPTSPRNIRRFRLYMWYLRVIFHFCSNAWKLYRQISASGASGT